MCCSYGEVLRFTHATAAALSEQYASGLALNPDDCLVHSSGENFDADIYSPKLQIFMSLSRNGRRAGKQKR